MSATTPSTSPAPPTSPPPTHLPPLWVPDQRVEIIGLTGEYESGKTVFGLTIDPARTLMYDEEKSGASYLSLGFTRLDIITEVRKKHPHGFTPLQVYEWWVSHVRTIEPGRYRVIMLDTVGTVEAGLADWVNRNPKHFGHTAGQYEKMSGLFWGDVKEHWKLVLSDLASRCETFVFTTHMGNVWKGNQQTGKKKPKGKETLMELASLYLQMERLPGASGNKPAQPSAVVLKSRLAHASLDGETGSPVVVPLLPPRLPVATPAAIRKYMLAPPDYSRLKPEELAPERGLSADERLELETAKAQAEAEAERLRADARSGGREQTSTVVASQVGSLAEVPGMITRAQLEQIVSGRVVYLARACGPAASKEDMAAAWKGLLAKWNVDTATKLTEGQAGELIAALTGEMPAGEKQAEAAPAAPPSMADGMAAINALTDQQFAVMAAVVEGAKTKLAADQLAEIKRLAPLWMQLNGPNPPDKAGASTAWQAMLRKRFNVGTAAQLTTGQAAELIGTLKECEANPTAGLLGPATNGQAAGRTGAGTGKTAGATA